MCIRATWPNKKKPKDQSYITNRPAIHSLVPFQTKGLSIQINIYLQYILPTYISVEYLKHHLRFKLKLTSGPLISNPDNYLAWDVVLGWGLNEGPHSSTPLAVIPRTKSSRMELIDAVLVTRKNGTDNMYIYILYMNIYTYTAYICTHCTCINIYEYIIHIHARATAYRLYNM